MTERKIRKPRRDSLTPKQYAFLLHYMEHGNAAHAYRVAYGPSTKPRNDVDKAKGLLKSPNVARALALARHYAERQLALKEPPAQPGAAIVSPLAQRYAITQERAAQMLSLLAATDARDYFEWGPDGVKIKPSAELTAAQAYGVVEVSQTVTKDGGTIRVKLADKLTALRDLARLRGWTEQDQEPPPDPASDEKKRRAKEAILKMLADLAKPEPLVIEGRSTSDGDE